MIMAELAAIVHNVVNQLLVLTFSDDFLTTDDNPIITTTVGGYAQVWVTYHKKPDNSEIWTANTINFI